MRQAFGAFAPFVSEIELFPAFGAVFRFWTAKIQGFSAVGAAIEYTGLQQVENKKHHSDDPQPVYLEQQGRGDQGDYCEEADTIDLIAFL